MIALYTAVSLVLLGRGVFCGWLCPFGALQELINEAARKLKIRQYEVPFAVHERLWAIKYIVLLVLFAHSSEAIIAIDAVVAGSLLRVLNEMAVIGGRSAVSLMLRALLRDIDRGGGQSSFLSVYDGATELVDQAIAAQPGCPE